MVSSYIVNTATRIINTIRQNSSVIEIQSEPNSECAGEGNNIQDFIFPPTLKEMLVFVRNLQRQKIYNFRFIYIKKLFLHFNKM